MIIEVKVPQLSESVAEATLVSWHKKAGQAIKADENLVDIETDKVVLETPAPAAGVLVKIIKPDGSSVVSKEVIAQIDTEATATAPADDAAPAVAPVVGVQAILDGDAQRAREIDDVFGKASGFGGCGLGWRVDCHLVARRVLQPRPKPRSQCAG